jgi:hypothetical protein
MNVQLHHGDIHLLNVRTRMPFKYGIATMTRAPYAFVRMFVTVDGREATGVSADLLPPKWFTKDPARPIEDEVAEMAEVIDNAVRLAAGLQGPSPFDVWRQLWQAQGDWGRQQHLPPLLTHFGTSLVERAMLDAVCRTRARSFHQLLKSNELGIRLGEIHPELQGFAPADFVADRPLERIIARHTIGLADPLTEDEIPPAERLYDGLPQSLEACIRTYGLRNFKIKVSGKRGQDIDRLLRIEAVLSELAPRDYGFSLDGNEQFRSLAEFDSWRTIMIADYPDPAVDLYEFFQDHLLFIEQPFHRDVALTEGLGHLNGGIIIDESDADLTSLRRALELGYAGTSHKNCKGVFKGIANHCLLLHKQRQQPERLFLMSGEDLANIGPVALLQDLAVCAALGIKSVERNGHHYFAGLSMFPAEVQDQLRDHGDLYRPSRDGWPTLDIQDGMLRLDSINAAPFGVRPLVDVEKYVSLEAWRAERGLQTHK